MADQVAELLKVGLRKSRDKAFRALDKLKKVACRRGKTRKEATQAIRRIGLEGQDDMLRLHAGFALIAAAIEGDVEATVFFREQLGNPDLCYSCMAGLLITIGTEAYDEIVDVANDANHTMVNRGEAVQTLAEHSGHPFDRQLPEDFNTWEEKHLLLDELNAWAERGYPEAQALPVEIPVAELAKQGIVLPKEYEAFLKSQIAGEKYIYKENPWRLATAERLLETVISEKRKCLYIRRLEGFAKILTEFFDGDSTVDNKGLPYAFSRLAGGLAIGDDDCGDILYLDTSDQYSVWVFHHDGGDVEKLGRSFKAWLTRTKKQKD